MADVGAPAATSQEPPLTQWPNRKEDYELLDVIGQYLNTAPYNLVWYVICAVIVDIKVYPFRIVAMPSRVWELPY